MMDLFVVYKKNDGFVSLQMEIETRNRWIRER